MATKSGSNQLRGTVYEFFRNDALAANTFDNNANEVEAGKFDRHQVALGTGGPIVKDKVHFFTSLTYSEGPTRPTRRSAGSRRPSSSPRVAPATQSFFRAYGGTPAASGTVLTRMRRLG